MIPYRPPGLPPASSTSTDSSGSVLWTWIATKSADYTASNGEAVPIDPTVPFTLSMPENPEIGWRVKVANSTAADSDMTYSGNGHNIRGASTYVVGGAYLTLIFEWDRRALVCGVAVIKRIGVGILVALALGGTVAAGVGVADRLQFSNGGLSLLTKPTTGQAIVNTGSGLAGGSVAALGGGTGQTSYTTGDTLYASGTTALSKLSIGTDGYTFGVSSGLPSWRSPTQMRTTLSIGNVENTALSTWAGSTSLVTLGTVTTGTWNGSAIGRAYNGYQVVTQAGAPTVNDDSGDGYSVGQVIVDSTAKVPYMLVDSTLGAAIWRSVLPVGAYVFRYVSGVPCWAPQSYTSSGWVDVGSCTAMTVELAGSWTTSGATITEPSGTTNNTQPHSSSYLAYVDLSTLPLWSTTFGTTYALDLDVTSASWVANARFGVALATPTGAYDASSESIVSQRIGSTGPNQTQQVSNGTGTYTTGYLGVASPSLAREVVSPGIASGFYSGNGTSTASGTLTIPTTLPTRLYFIGGAATSATGSACTMTPLARLTISSR